MWIRMHIHVVYIQIRQLRRSHGAWATDALRYGGLAVLRLLGVTADFLYGDALRYTIL